MWYSHSTNLLDVLVEVLALVASDGEQFLEAVAVLPGRQDDTGRFWQLWQTAARVAGYTESLQGSQRFCGAQQHSVNLAGHGRSVRLLEEGSQMGDR